MSSAKRPDPRLAGFSERELLDELVARRTLAIESVDEAIRILATPAEPTRAMPPDGHAVVSSRRKGGRPPSSGAEGIGGTTVDVVVAALTRLGRWARANEVAKEMERLHWTTRTKLPYRAAYANLRRAHALGLIARRNELWATLDVARAGNGAASAEDDPQEK